MSKAAVKYASDPIRGKNFFSRVTLTLPTVPIALTYVQLLAREFRGQYCFSEEKSNISQGQHLPQMDMYSGGKTTKNLC